MIRTLELKPFLGISFGATAKGYITHSFYRIPGVGYLSSVTEQDPTGPVPVLVVEGDL